MPKLHELREELRALRKESNKPVSRMKKGDISAEIEKLRVHRESTPAVAAVPSAPSRISRAAVESIKEAKRHEFPVKPGKEPAAAPKKAAPAEKKMSKAEMRRMIEELTSDEEE